MRPIEELYLASLGGAPVQREGPHLPEEAMGEASDGGQRWRDAARWRLYYTGEEMVALRGWGAGVLA